MKTVVIYTSQTGFTKRYAEWIALSAGADCMELSEAKRADLSPYEAIVFGGWACAGGISKLGWFKGNMDKWADKRRIVFCVGASPAENPDIAAALRQNFSDAQWAQVKVFYCPGGFNYEKMPAGSKLMMKMFIRALKAKKNKTEAEREMLKRIGTSYDISDRKYIDPILQALEQ